ncbi:unnamed protein product [Spirodela intermedia]|uniref:SCP domain-containing protein n=1 Tax=Spirodela intermedia TaxID=51605 RepID=A0A7I8L704_SPIIN|nr:unnamed protein product [Spirodela intermedia]
MVSWRPSSVALLVVALGFALLHHSSAQNSPANYLRPHNAARAAVGVEPLTWDPTLQEYAQNYAEERAGDCDLVHSQGPYGENIFWGWGKVYNAKDAVQSWVNEEQYYDYDSNSCQEGKVCGHYTQVVWRNTERVGCGRVRCDSGAYFIVCSYDPRGNWEGEWPYRFSS